MNDDSERETFDDAIAVALAFSTVRESPEPPADLRARILAGCVAAPLPAGFRIERAAADTWRRHPVPGIRMKVLAVNEARNYATLLLDVSPGARFPAHRHAGAEECYVVSGSLHTCGRLLRAGDFVHADPETEHGELRSDEGCQVILIVPVDELSSGPAR